MISIVEVIRAGISNYLEEYGYIDGYVYFEDEWRLLEVRKLTDCETYYALIEVDSDELEAKESLYEIYCDGASIEEIATDIEMVRVGSRKEEFPSEAVDVIIYSQS